jgi:RecB family endonuclease NucS
MALDQNDNLVVVELKAKREKGEAFFQLLDYMHSTVRQLTSTPPLGKNTRPKVRGIIVAPSFDERFERAVRDMSAIWRKRIPFRIVLRRYMRRGGAFEFPI